MTKSTEFILNLIPFLSGHPLTSIDSLLGGEFKHDTIVPLESQKGGLTGSTTTEIADLVHASFSWPSFEFAETQDNRPNGVFQKIDELLRAPITSVSFGQFQGPNGQAAQVPNCSNQLSKASSQNPLVEFSLSPSSGTIVHPGDSIEIRFSVTGGNPIKGVLFALDGLLHKMDGPRPFSFLYTIPDNRSGNINISADTFGDGPENYSVSTFVVSRPSLPPLSITATPDHLQLNLIGQLFQVHVAGKFIDGSTIDLTSEAAGTSYSLLSGGNSVVSVNAEGLIIARGFGQDTLIISNSGKTAAVDVVVEMDASVRTHTTLLLSTGGASTVWTAGTSDALQAGYATLTVNTGKNSDEAAVAAPYATAVFSVTQNGVVVSEVGVPASPPTTSARLFIDYGTSVSAKSGDVDAGTISTNTGVAMVNRGTGTANISYRLRGVTGTQITQGQGTLAQNAHRALFINELNQVASGFSLPTNFPTTTRFGSLEITSDQPLSIVALRMTTNQRGNALFTTTPVADLTQAPTSLPIYFPQLADGGGYTFSLFLLNTSITSETGTIRILGNNGNPLAVRRVGESGASSMFNYNIPAGGLYVLTTDGSPSTTNVGSVQVTPDPGNSTPVGAGLFGYSPAGTLVTETGVPSATPTTRARIYLDRSGGHNTGIAIAAPSGNAVPVTLNAYMTDGVTPVGGTSFNLNGNGHDAKFANEYIAGIPDGFTGVLDISSPTPFVALTLRGLVNTRGDFLLTTFPIADFTRPAPTPIVFPQVADGGGYKTQFIFMSTSGSASTVTLNFFDSNGAPLSVGKTAQEQR